MSARVVWAQVDEHWRRALLVTNERELLADLLLRLDVEHRWSVLRRGYGISLIDLPDVEASAEEEHWVVRRRRNGAGGRR